MPCVTDVTWLDATAQADLVRRGEVSPTDLVEAAIGRIEALNPRLGAVIRTRFDQARAEAAGALPDGPFRGVPILFKDLGCVVAGEVTASGLGPLRDLPWPVTSNVARQLRAAGFVSLGRTSVPEARGGHLTGHEAAQVLEQDRHAAERAVRQRARGLGPSLVKPGPDHRAQPGVERLDPADRRLHQVLGADLAAAHEVGLGGGIKPGQIGHAWHGTAPGCGPGRQG